MSQGFALILAGGASLLSLSVQASPIHFGPMQKATSDVTLVRDFCGLGFHRGPYGYCMRNGIVATPPVIVAPSHVVVAPSPVVAPTVVCPLCAPTDAFRTGHCLLF